MTWTVPCLLFGYKFRLRRAPRWNHAKYPLPLGCGPESPERPALRVVGADLRESVAQRL